MRNDLCFPCMDDPIHCILTFSNTNHGLCDDGFITFKSTVKEREYRTCGAGESEIVSDKMEENEPWKTVESHKHVGIFIESKNHEWHLVCNGEDESFYASNDSKGEESWLLQPMMPSIGGTMALVSIVAMPFAVMGVVGAMGFTGSGIAGGSVAAGMMSAEAVSLGGGVVAGGTVATLQSIGAAGVGAAVNAAAIGAGSVVGAALLRAAVAATSQISNVENSGKEVAKLDRPDEIVID